MVKPKAAPVLNHAGPTHLRPTAVDEEADAERPLLPVRADGEADTCKVYGMT